ncbi:hypothetical protein SEA_KWEKEL_26 [Gordonia phage Kwekel]|uniref:Uncharacterized protein n=1 Tax=Gordonia phage Kwekel TaxID=3077820 RepID=A0AA96R2E6_9CAUD|nr:hypothetical protein SEA_KWEKEL_26 [Gordonia phage Kwekel]
MAEVTIEAQQSFGGIRAGEVVTVERTAYVDRLIKNNRVVVVEADDTGEPGNDPADGAFDPSTAPTTPPASESAGTDTGEDDADDSDTDGDDGTD